MNHYKMKLDNDSIRFTPDGKVAVVDAIKALSARDDAGGIWESLKNQYPELKEICQIYGFKEDESDCVVDGEAWQMIEDALYNYMISHTTSA
ncbi:MAG: hypothetical protein PVJ35_05040 [Desulfobacterales bacterium]|jgi:hypothetical protein